MKNILIVFTLMIAGTNTNAQNYDSLKRVITELTLEQNSINMNIQRAHEQFSSGTLIMGIGLSTGIIGAVLYSLQSEDPGPMPQVMMAAGGAAAAVGGIIQIDSHKWFSRKRHQN